MPFIRRLIARLRSWHLDRRRAQASVVPMFIDLAAPIHREVTASGVRVFSLCGACGARLQASATLCEECAQKKSRPARPF